MLKKGSFFFLSTLIGGVFIVSGFTKLFPVEPFEYTFVDLGIFSWELAPFAARILIGLEFFIGVLFVFNVSLHKIAYKLGALLLLFFCIYLSVVILFVGNKGNCGCFGSAIEMTPLQALLKNSGMFVVIALLYKYHEGWLLKGKFKIIPGFLFVAAFILPFILNPVELDIAEAYTSRPSENYQLELDSLYNNASLQVPPKTLSEGKHILAFMSLTCSHCKIAAKKMGIIHKNNPGLSFYFVLNGNESQLNFFFEETATKGIDHCMLLGSPFSYLINGGLPSIYLINNSIVEHQINYLNMNQSAIERWMMGSVKNQKESIRK